MLRRFSGFPAIIVATVVAGVAGYLITWLVPRIAGPGLYAIFAIFWSFLYLLVGALSGIQQEVTRATIPSTAATQRRAGTARNFGVASAVVVLLAIMGTAPLWKDLVFPGFGWQLALPLAVGAASYVLVATLSGTLYGVGQWSSLALLVSLDAVLRIVLIAIALLFTSDIVVLAWLVAAPFPIVILLLWPIIRGRIVGRSDLDVAYRALSWNVSRTVVAAASMGVLVSGFPLLLHLTSPGEANTTYGLMVLAITLTRAPLITTVMAAQSILVVRFRDFPSRFWATFNRIVVVILVCTGILSILGWWLGPWAFAILFGTSFVVSGWLIAVLVGSSGIVGILSVCGAALLARTQHFAYTAGWVCAAMATLGLLLLPLSFEMRTVVALMGAPCVGVVIGVVALLRGRRRTESLRKPHMPQPDSESHLT
ncbi:lipopolysaccharide biosynthesis protein [Cryobacterium serini]|uniref:Polysaccharide biosynthesis protein n=1 Tax=Cryobacterium serini TaxID=1259201 RepID=A0A4R9BKI4_9MICO|nr:hypothetical protein [Cryobacterium serini]TFD86274.1 hypothetical protein E3T51_14250 [Cryobacterium serini]